MRWRGGDRTKRPATNADGGAIGAEHAWWAARPRLSGVPVDRVAERRRAAEAAQWARAEADARRRAYWSPEHLFRDSRHRRGRAEHPSMAEGADPWLVLGVGPDATLAEAGAARRRLARRFHPDVAGDDAEAAARMAEVNAAYDLLRRACLSN